MKTPMICAAVFLCLGLPAAREIKQNRRDIEVMCKQLQQLDSGACQQVGPTEYTCTGGRVSFPLSCLPHQGAK